MILFRMLSNSRGEVAPPAGAPPAGGEPATPPAGGEAAAPPAAISREALSGLKGDGFLNALPEEIRTQGYMKDVNSFEDFFKKFDGAQKLIGQRAVPGEGATPEQWDAFFKQAGRPDKPEGYVLKDVDGVPKEFTEGLRKTGILPKGFHAAGLNPYQAQKFADFFVKEVFAAEAAEKKTADNALNSTLDTIFGKDREAVVANGKAAMAAHLPDSVKALLDQLDEKGLGVALAVADSVARKFGGEDTFRGGGGSGAGGSTPVTEASIRAEMTKIFSTPEYSDPFKNAAKNAELTQKMESLRAQLKGLKK